MGGKLLHRKPLQAGNAEGPRATCGELGSLATTAFREDLGCWTSGWDGEGRPSLSKHDTKDAIGARGSFMV